MAQSPHTPPSTLTAPDGELAASAAAGDVDAFDELYRRHAGAAWRVAMAVAANPDDAADAVADAFARLFRALPSGRLAEGVPFRPYLLKATRNAAIDTLRRGERVQPTHDFGALDVEALAAGPSERVVSSEEGMLVADAFRQLPERWRSVLWLTEIEDMPARDVAVVLGMSANAVSQLAIRARAGLRRNFLQAHVGNHVAPRCRYSVDRLGAYVAGALSRREIDKVERHVEGCDSCRARLADLEDLGTTLRRSVMPIPVPLALGAAVRSARPARVLGFKLTASSAAQKALAGVTAAVLAFGIGAALVRPHGAAPIPVRAAPAPSQAPPESSVLALAGVQPGTEPTASAPANSATTASAQGHRGDSSATDSSPAAGAPSSTTDNPTGTTAPPQGTTPQPPATPGRQTPVVQVNVGANALVANVAGATGIGPGSCTGVTLGSTSSTCVEPRDAPGVTVGALGALLPTPLRVSLP